MRTLPGWLLPAVMVAAVAHSPAAAGAAAAPPAGPAIELLAPQAAIPLVAGAKAVLQWAPRPGLAALPASEEWEAFLSLDGGKSYGFRITPHLDSDLRQVLWDVPDTASADVRLLLRFGDERRETVIELPQRFTISPGTPISALTTTPAIPANTAIPANPANPATIALPPTLAARAVLAPHPGEAARPGDQGVTVWAEGSRRDTARRQMVAVFPALDGDWREPELAREPATLAGRPARTEPPAPARRAPWGSPPRTTAAAPRLERHETLPPIDRMLQTSRLNE
ncbi:MAG TPA: hypothetical protein VKY89_08770 [Thermoanaerobaculia bacterium]|nr:hypothetical protein [Thermoanaerobaculia bacterium]